MKIDTQLQGRNLSEIAAFAARIERLGFDGGWTFEAGCDPFLPIALAAPATKTLALGTNVAIAFARSPMSMALAAWDLQKLSNGRMHLGIGTQVRAHIERRYSMPYDHPVARLTDYVRCMRAIWRNFQSGEKPDYKGEFYSFTLMNPMFTGGKSEHPDVPVYFAGVNPLICKAAGEVADGFHLHPLSTVGYLRDVVLPKVEEGAKAAGRKLSDVTFYLPVFAITGDTPGDFDKAEKKARRQISFYGSTPTYRPVLEHAGHGDIARQLSEHARRGEWDQMEKLVPDDLLEKVALVAKPAEFAKALRKRYAGIVDRVSLYDPVGGEDEDANWKRFIADFRAAA
jgi:probable F420-dependent oxidoreductase